ncbi:MAG: M28 family peptidase [Bacteroidota bacterium]
MKFLLSLTCLSLLSSIGWSQNQAPVISHMSAEYEYRDRRLEVRFDLSDAENDSLEVWALLSDDAGETFTADFSAATGDVGPSIAPGTDKSIVWIAPHPINFLDHRVKIIVNDGYTIDIQSMVDQVDSTRMKNDLLWLAQERTSTPGPALDHLNAVKDSLESIFTQGELEAYRHQKNLGTYTLENIIGRRVGLKHESISYLVDAHFDGVSGTDAADDNGSGTVGVMECARILSQYEFAHSLRFIGFDQEETGLQGSIAYVTDEIPAYEVIDGVLNFEMIGYYDDRPNSQQFPTGFEQLFPTLYNEVAQDSFRGNFITSVSNDQSNPLRLKFDSCAMAYVPDLLVRSFVTPANGLLTPDLLRSDHAPFWQTNRPALMLTDGAEFRNHNYHSPGDSVATINMNFFHQVVKAAVATLATLAQPLNADVSIAEFSLISGLSDLEEMCGLKIRHHDAQFELDLQQGNCVNASSSLTLIDLSGRVIHQVNIGPSFRHMTISTADLSPGIYLWTMESSKGILSEKVLIR